MNDEPSEIVLLNNKNLFSNSNKHTDFWWIWEWILGEPRRLRQEEDRLKCDASLGYMVNSRPAKASYETFGLKRNRRFLLSGMRVKGERSMAACDTGM